MHRVAVVPGSFDPPTLGHLDMIERASKLCDELHVVVVHNPRKTPLLPLPQRRALLEQVVLDLTLETDLVVTNSLESGLLADYCKQVGASLVVKGLRSHIDVEYERPMAVINRDLACVETVFVVPDPSLAYVSSTLVRELFSLGGDVGGYVSPHVADFLANLESGNTQAL